ncbi:hypothetical protein BZG02_07550 [Labilibaculum filiforme]|uniref:ASCH domain-containing protein n=1 Tax=Labilibaculum filiforme TaxID=1940526 RepID=A0A2N3I0L7_9BACT|nr:ASCH domain-containing protein [Labilibaculum filiforme]PKQ63866.1 hypothetical protein BZG02_07550 [Labilibaculum filiforme]
MSQIHFHDDFYIPILKGNKTQTARVHELIPSLGNGEAIFNEKSSISIDITKVKHKSFDDMSLKEVQKDGFTSKNDLWTVLIGFYPELKKSDLLMLIEFQTIK